MEIDAALDQLSSDDAQYLANVPIGRVARRNLPEGLTMTCQRISADDVSSLGGWDIEGYDGGRLYTIVAMRHDDYDSDWGSITCWCNLSCQPHEHLVTEVL